MKVYTIVGNASPDGVCKWQETHYSVTEAIKILSGKITFRIDWQDEFNPDCINTLIIYSPKDKSSIAKEVAAEVVNRFAGMKFIP